MGMNNILNESNPLLVSCINLAVLSIQDLCKCEVVYYCNMHEKVIGGNFSETKEKSN